MARQPALVSKEDLFKALWPDVAVTDNALTQAVSELRQALGDDPSKPTYVQTVARRGYRFIAPVATAAPGGVVPQPSASTGAAPSFEVLAEQRAIAVLDFSNVSGDKELGSLSSGIAETVTNDLRATAPLRVVDRMRVVEAVRRCGSDLSALRAELHVDLAVVGSFQRSGPRLRITARVVDAITGEATAEAKADGPLEQVFDLQDRIVTQFSEALRIGTKQPRSLGDTSSLDAYRAFTEGRVRLESLGCVRGGGGHRRFREGDRNRSALRRCARRPRERDLLAVRNVRARNQPDGGLLARAVDCVRRAIELERDLADAYATLSFLLMSAGRAPEAVIAARRAVALEPRYWGNQFRLAHAAWGEERLVALARARDLYQDFPFVHFEMAMVHIARGQLDRAEPVLREGTVVQDRQADRKQRYPAKGLHWLLGLVRLACGDAREALREFEYELASGSWQLYAREFAMNAHDGAGFAHLDAGDAQPAIDAFNKALELFPEHARSLVGSSAAHAAAGDKTAASSALDKAVAAIDGLRRGGRASEAMMAEAMLHAVRGDAEKAIGALNTLLDKPDMPFSGWTIPIEPLFESLRRLPDYQKVTARLAERAR